MMLAEPRYESMLGTMVVAEAYRWLGTPWRHQGRRRGIGCDCIGFIGGVALMLSFPSARKWVSDLTTKGYGRQPDAGMLRAACNRHLVPVTDPEPGDIYCMAYEGQPKHFAILSRLGYVLHAYAFAPRMVCEMPLDGVWYDGATGRSLIVSAWRYKEVAAG